MSGIVQQAQKYFLLIDDDEDDRLLFTLALSEVEPSIKCRTAQNQEEVELLLADGELPDLIFLDLNMPVKSGWEFLEQFKKDERLGNIPIIIYSTSSSQRDIDRARELRALCFLVKPDDFTELKRFLAVMAARSTEELLHDLRNNPRGTCHILVE